MSRLLLRPSKYLSSLREGYAAISLLIPFLKAISSIAAGEYPVGLDEGMGPAGTGSGPFGLGRWCINYVLNIVEVCWDHSPGEKGWNGSSLGSMSEL